MEEIVFIFVHYFHVISRASHTFLYITNKLTEMSLLVIWFYSVGAALFFLNFCSWKSSAQSLGLFLIDDAESQY